MINDFMEILDILDENGQLTGERSSREEVHQKGLWHRVVHIWILNSRGEVLIQKRSARKLTSPNLWVMSCEGHLAAGDSSEETVLKELHEELGLSIEPADIEFLYGYKRKSITNNGTYFGNHFIDVFLIRSDFNVADLKLQEEEVAEVRWIKIDEMADLVKAKDPSFKDYPGQYPEIFERLKKAYRS